MSDEIRVNRPVPPQAPMRDMGAGQENNSGEPSKAPWVILGIVILAVVVLGVLFQDKLGGKKMDNKEGEKIITSSNKYQAIFLTNGQVYFGKLSETHKDFVKLTDIYYLQVVQPPLQGQQQPGQNPPGQQPQISLVKLGNELHGPVDEMKINRSQVLFYEDLKSDGQVVKAIEAYKTNPNQPSQQPVQP